MENREHIVSLVSDIVNDTAIASAQQFHNIIEESNRTGDVSGVIAAIPELSQRSDDAAEEIVTLLETSLRLS